MGNDTMQEPTGSLMRRKLSGISPRARRWAGAAAWGAAIAVLVWRLAQIPIQAQSMMADDNMIFAARDSLSEALALHRKYWTPLYPTVLWLARRAGAGVGELNVALFLATLAGMGLLARAAAPDARAEWPVFLGACAYFNYVQFEQAESECLFIPLGVFLAAALVAHHRRPGWPSLAALGVLCGALSATRYFGIFWGIPLVGLHLLAIHRREAWRALAGKIAAFIALAAAPPASWMWRAWQTTGYLSGMNRFRGRDFSMGAKEFAPYQGSWVNAWLVVKGTFVDFFSPDRHAAAGVMMHAYQPTIREWICLGLLLVCAAQAVFLLARRPPGRIPWNAPAAIVLQFYAWHAALLAILWKLGNNDPMHSRFLVPGYPFLTLCAFALYQALQRRVRHPAALLAFHALVAMFLVASFDRHFHVSTVLLR